MQLVVIALGRWESVVGHPWMEVWFRLLKRIDIGRHVNRTGKGHVSAALAAVEWPNILPLCSCHHQLIARSIINQQKAWNCARAAPIVWQSYRDCTSTAFSIRSLQHWESLLPNQSWTALAVAALRPCCISTTLSCTPYTFEVTLCMLSGV